MLPDGCLCLYLFPLHIIGNSRGVGRQQHIYLCTIPAHIAGWGRKTHLARTSYGHYEVQFRNKVAQWGSYANTWLSLLLQRCFMVRWVRTCMTFLLELSSCFHQSRISCSYLLSTILYDTACKFSFAPDKAADSPTARVLPGCDCMIVSYCGVWWHASGDDCPPKGGRENLQIPSQGSFHPLHDLNALVVIVVVLVANILLRLRCLGKAQPMLLESYLASGYQTPSEATVQEDCKRQD